MRVSKPLNCLKGLVSTDIQVNTTARLVVADEIKDPEATTVSLSAVNASKVNLLASENMSSSYRLIFPPNQGGQNEYLQLINNGALQWTAIDGSTQTQTSGQENAWNFGTIAQLWCAAEGDPFATGVSKLPITRSPLETNAVLTTESGVRFLRIGDGAAGAVISWDVSNSPTDWDFRVSLNLNTFDNNNARGFFLFGNDTINTASSGVIGIRPQDSTGVLFQVTHSGSGKSHPLQIREKGLVKKSLNAGFPMNSAGGRTVRLQRKGNKIRIGFEPFRHMAASQNTFNAEIVIEYPLTETYTGTRWGIGSFGGLVLDVTNIELRRM
jgi:hypothetical protein